METQENIKNIFKHRYPFKLKSLEQVIKQKCKFLGNTNSEEYRIGQITYGVRSKYLLHITNTTIETANKITLLEEIKPLFVYLCSCILHEGLNINWDELRIKIQFYRTTLGCNDDITFSAWLVENYENPIKSIETRIRWAKANDYYMGFLKPFRLEIFLPPRGRRVVIANNYNSDNDSDSNNKNDKECDINTYKEDVCVVCMENKSDILFCNCGHLIVCGDCYHELENDKCPKCRKVNLIIRKM